MTPTHSAAALATLGSGLAAAALEVGRTPIQMSQEFTRDPTLWIDRCGLPFFVDPPAPQAVAPAAAEETAALPIAPADAFSLHSAPGAQRTIYLDFTGEVISNTAWGASTWTAPAYDTDGHPATFSAAERAVVIEVWQRVADDYAPFTVDVTTEEPDPTALERRSSADLNFGTRALISPDPGIAEACSCGGWAYVDVFDSVGDNLYYQPAWVLPQNLGWSAKNIAEAASHEVGHNLSLSHDGRTNPAEGYYRGSDGWAPIMGVGYYQPVTQWSRGEYPQANNQQDDLALMANSGVPLRPDDVGDSPATASILTPGAPTTGRITTQLDSDWYSITAAGRIEVTAAPLAPAPDLDIGLTLTDAAGAPLASSAPPYVQQDWPAFAAASLSHVAAVPTTMLIQVDGTGNGAVGTDGWTDYASLGEYALQVRSLPYTPPISPPAMTVGAAATVDLPVVGGQSPYTWRLASGALPAGLSLSGARLAGTPTEPTSSQVTLAVSDANGDKATAMITLTVRERTTITTPGTVNATAESPLQLTLTSENGVAPVSWSVVGDLPAGLTRSGASITGTPSAAGSTAVTIRATDANGEVTEQPLTFNVAAPLAITSAVALTPTAGTALAHTLTTTGGRAPISWSITAGSLPAGLILANGAITGTAGAQSTTSVTITATDANNARRTQPLSITVAAAPALADQTHAGTVGRPLSPDPVGSGGTQPVVLTVISGALPQGVALADGRLTGTPSTAGASQAVVRMTDSNGATDEGSLTFSVVDPPRLTVPAEHLLTAGHPVDIPISVAGGQPPLSWSVPAELPEGLTLASGRISGTPIAATDTWVTVAVTDRNDARQQIDLRLDIADRVRITAPAPPTPTVGGPVDLTLATSGGHAPIVWTTPPDSLPPGLTMRASSISGTPTTAGRYPVLLTATDAIGAADSRWLIFDVAAAPQPSMIGGTGTVGQPMSALLTATAGTPPLSWEVSGDTAGLVWAGDQLSGMPTRAGSFPITLTVADANGVATSVQAVLTIADRPSGQDATSSAPGAASGWSGAGAAGPVQPDSGAGQQAANPQIGLRMATGADLGIVAKGKRCQFRISAIGGKGKLKWKRAGKLPKGMKLTKAGILKGKPTKRGRQAFTLSVTDAAGARVIGLFTLTVR